MLNFVTSLLPCIYLLAAVCPALGTPNGQFGYNAFPSEGNYPVGSIASLSCSVGHFSPGTRDTTCQASGDWTEPLPVCNLSNEICF